MKSIWIFFVTVYLWHDVGTPLESPLIWGVWAVVVLYLVAQFAWTEYLDMAYDEYRSPDSAIK